MRVTAEEIANVVDWTRDQCSEAIANHESVTVLGKPSIPVIALQMGSVALWLLGQIALSLYVASEPDPIEPVETIKTPKRGRPRKTAA